MIKIKFVDQLLHFTNCLDNLSYISMWLDSQIILNKFDFLWCIFQNGRLATIFVMTCGKIWQLSNLHNFCIMLQYSFTNDLYTIKNAIMSALVISMLYTTRLKLSNKKLPQSSIWINILVSYSWNHENTMIVIIKVDDHLQIWW